MINDQIEGDADDLGTRLDDNWLIEEDGELASDFLSDDDLDSMDNTIETEDWN